MSFESVLLHMKFLSGSIRHGEFLADHQTHSIHVWTWMVWEMVDWLFGLVSNSLDTKKYAPKNVQFIHKNVPHNSEVLQTTNPDQLPIG